MVLAVALHDETNWPIFSIAYPVTPRLRNLLLRSLHCVVRHPSGDFLDIEGLRAQHRILQQYRGGAIFGVEPDLIIEPMSRQAAIVWGNRAGGVSIETARKYVQPLLAGLEKG